MSTTPQPPSAGPGAQTPSRRATNATPTSTFRRAPVHTPLDRSVTRDLLRSIRRGTPASAGRRRSNAPTPHAKAARRALDQRRTDIFTPGKKRRESMMERRETPMGILGKLAKVLVDKNGPRASSSTSASSSPPRPGRRSSVRPIREDSGEEDDFVDQDQEISSDDPLPDKPDLSLAIAEDYDNDQAIPPPRVSGLDLLEDVTFPLNEYARREPVQQRLSRGSLGSLRPSEYSDNDNEVSETEDQSAFFPQGWADMQGRPDANDPTLDRVDGDPTIQSVGQMSGFDLNLPPGVGEQTTFLMSEPATDAQPTSPIEDRSVTEALAGNAAEAGDPVVPTDIDSEQPPPFDDYSDEGNEPLPPFGDYSSEGNEPLPPMSPPMFDDPPEHVGSGEDSDLEQAEDLSANVTEGVTVTHTLGSSRIDRAQAALAGHDANAQLKLRRKRKRVSPHGIEYPPIPSAFVKQVAQTALQSSGLRNTRVSPDTLLALTQASDWFFEQLGDDLGAYAGHAKRKTIEDSDVATLMRRQRQVGSSSTLFSLAQKHLPRELLQELRMPLPQPTKQKRAKRARSAEDEEVEMT